MEKKCLDCGNTFKGRADKKFCSDQCRNSYNNKLKGSGNNYIRNVNNKLRKNRRILENLLEKNSRSNREKLLGLGFDFSYFTNTYTNQKGAVYYFCYEYGYLSLEKDLYLLVKWKEKGN